MKLRTLSARVRPHKITSVVALVALCGALLGQGNSGNTPGSAAPGNSNRIALPQDWSDRSVIYSAPGNSQKASDLSKDPRYVKQSLERNVAGSKNPNVSNSAGTSTDKSGKKNPPPPSGAPQGDWNYSLGPSGASHVAAGMFPAKYNFDINQAPSCTLDFVVFGQNATGAAASSASQSGSFSASNGTGTVTVNGSVLTATIGTAASKGGTFTAQPSAGAVTITNGSTMTISNGGTAKVVTGTFSGGPVLTADSITVTTGGNALALKAGGTAAQVAGTFSAPPTSGSIVLNYNGTNPLTLTDAATSANVTGTFSGSLTTGTTSVTVNGTTATFTDGVASGSGTFSGNICVGTGQGVTINGVNLTTNATLPTGGNVSWSGSQPDTTSTFTITGPSGSQVYTFQSGSGFTGGGTSNLVLVGDTLAHTAANLRAAINNNSAQCGNTTGSPAACFRNVTTANPNVTAAINGSNNQKVDLTALCTGQSSSYTLNGSGSGGSKLNESSTAFSGGSLGSNTGTNFGVSTSTTTMATNLATAIGNNSGTNVTATSGGTSTVSLTASTGGSAGNVSLSQSMSSGFSWSGAALTGGDSSNACTSSTSGNFLNSSTSATAASNFKTALDSCISQGFPATTSLSGSAVTVTSTGIGSSVTITDSENIGNFSWGTITNGTDGSTACTSSTTATYANSTNITILAQNLTSAINSCAVGVTAIQGNGINGAGPNGSVVTALAPGSAVTLSTTGTTANNFSWGSVTAGTDGSNGCSSSTVGTFVNSNSSSTLAGNLASAITSCHNSFSAVNATAAQGTGGNTNQTIVTDFTPGTAPILTVAKSSSLFSWGGVSAGADGSNGCPTLATATFATSTTTSTLATNLAAAVNACATSFGVSAGASSATTTITARTNGAAGNNIALGNTLTGFSWAAGTLTGGADGDNTGANFTTATDTTTIANNLRDAINRSAASGTVTASSSGSGVTVSANTAGSAGNSITTTTTMTSFSWGAGALSGGADGQPSILALNQLYSGTSTIAGDSGTFSSNSINGGNTLTITNPNTSTTLTLTASAPTGASQTGSFTAAPTGGQTATIQNGANSMVLTASTPATASQTGSFTGNVRNTGTITIANGGNTLTMTPNPTPAQLTGTLSGAFSGNDAITIRASNCTVGNTASCTLTLSSGGSNACSAGSTANTGTFVNSSTTSTLVQNIVNAINSCNGTTNVALFTAAVSTTTSFTVSSSTRGSDITIFGGLSGNPPNFGWSASSAIGADGSNACGSSTSGTFAISGTTSTEASNLAAAINLCPAAAGISASSSSATVTVTARSAGTSGNGITLSKTVTGFGWNTSSLAGGDDGSNSGLNFQIWSGASALDTTTIASNLAAAITRNTSANVPVTASNSGAQVTVTDTTAGTVGNSVTLNKTLSNFTWTASGLAGGSDGTNTGTSFSYWSVSSRMDTTTLAANIAAAINRSGNGSSVGVSAASSTNSLTLTATSSGSASNNITVANTFTGLNWTNSSLFGGTSSGLCNSGPSLTWSYNTKTGSGGPVTTSPVLSIDGTKIAYVESISSGSVLHILRPNLAAINGTGTEGTVVIPVTPSTVVSSTSGTAAADWAACLSTGNSCLFNLVYNSTTNSQSSPFYNYGTDALYVGDDGGKLWKVTGVFNGTPALATGGWASGLSIGVSQKLTGPVFDFNSNKILAGDDAGGMNTFNDSGSFGSRNATKFSSITDPPVLDGSTGKVHFFGVSLGAGNPQVVQTDATLSSFVTATAGTATGVTPKVHAGAFDNHYLSDATPVNGFVYMCGRASASTSPSLYRIGFNSSGVMSATADGNSLALGSTTTAECSPLTEIYNSGQTTDWIFVGVPGTCAAGGSTTGCVESVNVTSGFPGSIVAAGQSSGGTSGIVVDNVSSSGHASSLYYSTLGAATCTTASGSSSAGGCAVQRTQSGLQ